MTPESFYDRLQLERDDSIELRECIKETVSALTTNRTDAHRPGMLLGKIQSGKTRTFIGIIAAAFDGDYDVALVLTKGTKALARQTHRRISRAFESFRKEDRIQVHDIMHLPALVQYELDQKLVVVIKKEKNNLSRVIDAFENKFPNLKTKRVLIIDDEADFAGITFKRNKNNNSIEQGTIASQIDKLREIVPTCSFLQVTATPYSLYLQPDEYGPQSNGAFIFKPKRPAFTMLVPVHSSYVGGDFFFADSGPDEISYYLYEEVLTCSPSFPRS